MSWYMMSVPKRSAKNSMTTNIPYEGIDEYVRSHYSSSLMSDTKWIKLLSTIGDAFEEEVHSIYKTIHSEEVHKYSFYSADEQFFAEPLTYKEVEWIEFPTEYNDYLNSNNRKSGLAVYSQDVGIMLTLVNSIGFFDTVMKDKSLRVYAYR